MTPLYRLCEVSKQYVSPAETVQALASLTLTVEPGESIALTGPSGAGKTTLMNLLGGIDTPTKGEVWFGDLRLDQLSEGQRTAWRARHVGFVFQAFNLLPSLNAAQNVELPLLLLPLKAHDRRRRVDAALELVGLSDRGRHSPGTMSGGEQQRVAIARALVSDPNVLLCDEPTGNLDRETADSVLDLLELCRSELGKTIVIVTHDPTAAARCIRTVVIDKSRPPE